MEFNFDKVVNRRNTNSIKWDASPVEGLVPMWVADMDFKAAPVITSALMNKIEHGVFGYTLTPPEFYTAITNWWKKRHHFLVDREWIIPVTGVIPALSAILRALTINGDKVVIQPPVYNYFYTTITNCGCEIIENNLLYSDGKYSIDFDDLEHKTAEASVKLLVISNPHNPVGRVWTKQQLQKMGGICLKNNVIVISDEIHSDLVFNEFTHIPFASLGKAYNFNSITLSSPTKSFNLAGLQVGYFFTGNNDFRKAIQKILTLQEMELLSPFAITALIAAYNDGDAWLEALKKYLYSNYLYLKDFIAVQLPVVKVIPLEGTYLVWIDCSGLSQSSAAIAQKLLKEQKLWVNEGTMYGKSGEGFLRVNIACPQVVLKEGLSRLITGLNTY